MAERKETYLGNSKLKSSPEKSLKVVLGEQVVKTKNIVDGAVTSEKLADDVVTSDKIIPGAVTWDKLQEEIESRVSGALQSYELDTDRTWQSKQDFAQEVKATSFKVQDFDSADNMRTTIISEGRVKTSYNEDDDEDPESSSVVMNDKALSINLHKGRNSEGIPGDYSSSLSAESLRMGAQYITEESIETDRNKTAAIESKIPSAASPSNKLTDRDFVNSSIATNTATFQGTYNSIAEATEQVEDADLNDYIFIVRTDDTGNTLYDRYKWGHRGWVFEYSLNNSSFTAEQWAAINSGLTRNDRSIIYAANSNASTALTNSQNAVLTANTASSNASNAVEVADNNAHIVANLEGAWTGTSLILEFSTTTEYGTGANQVNYCYKDGLLYRAITTHTGAWDASHFEQISVFDLLRVLCGIEEIPTWESIKSQPTTVGTLVIYDDKLYKFDVARAADEEWDSTKVHQTSLWAEIDAMVKSDYEQVNIELKTETEEPLSNVEVVVTVEGEDAPRNLTTDNMGKCTTNIPKGVEYTVACASVPNYYPVETVVRRASIPVRYVNFTYIEDDTLTREAVKIALTYADSTLTKATWVRVSYGGENYQLALDENNVAETSIPLGTQYTVTFEDIEGYKTPAPQTYTAQLHGTRNINVRYNAPVSGVKWLMKNGAERELNDVTNSERLNGDIFGLIVQTSDLMQAGCSYVIPLVMLLTQSATSSGQWLSANVTVPHLQYFGSHAAALADFDGEANCLAIEQFIAEKAAEGTTYTSSMVSNCRNRVGGAEHFKDTKDYAVGDYVVYRNMLHVFTSPHTAGEWVDGETESMYGYIMPDGRVRRCFQPSYAQIYAFRLLRDRVNGFTTDVFGIGCCAIASGFWWTSTQSNAGNGVVLTNGGFASNVKNNYYALLPVLAY